MPLDASGNYRHNHESAQMHSQAAGKKYNAGGDNDEKQEDSGHTEVHDHGDGTFHTVHPDHGEVQHETIGHMHAHLSKIHGEEGHSHFHAHMASSGEHHSHSVRSGEEPESREHEDAQGMHEHLDDAMGGDHDKDPEEEEQQPAGAGLGGLY
jgi:hypothetical protein